MKLANKTFESCRNIVSEINIKYLSNFEHKITRTTLRHHLVDPYNVIVDVPSTQPNLCNHSKTFHSLESWNDKKNDVLARSSFDSIVKMLESQHADDIFTFVLERLTKDNLQVVYENTKFIFTAKVNELDLIKLKIPSNAELSGIFQGDRTMYDERIKDRLSCKICLKYDVPLLGGLPLSKPFQCLHYFHSQCITNWKEFGLTSGECRGHLNICFYCRSELSSQYTDLYDYDWNLDGTVTRSNNNKRFPSVVDNNKASTRLSLSDSNITNPNQIRDDQDDYLESSSFYQILFFEIQFEFFDDNIPCIHDRDHPSQLKQR